MVEIKVLWAHGECRKHTEAPRGQRHTWDRAQTTGKLSEQAWLGEEPAQGFGFCAHFQCFQSVFGSRGGLQDVEPCALLHMAQQPHIPVLHEHLVLCCL